MINKTGINPFFYVKITLGDYMKKIKILISILVIILITISILLTTNKTFFHNTYIGIDNQKIFIPKYSYFKDECCMTAATFYSLKSEKQLNKEISNYLKDFKYFEDNTTYGYKKGKLFIQEYKVINKILFREIIITY